MLKSEVPMEILAGLLCVNVSLSKGGGARMDPHIVRTCEPQCDGRYSITRARVDPLTLLGDRQTCALAAS